MTTAYDKQNSQQLAQLCHLFPLVRERQYRFLLQMGGIRHLRNRPLRRRRFQRASNATSILLQ